MIPKETNPTLILLSSFDQSPSTYPYLNSYTGRIYPQSTPLKISIILDFLTTYRSIRLSQLQPRAHIVLIKRKTFQISVGVVRKVCINDLRTMLLRV